MLLPLVVVEGAALLTVLARLSGGRKRRLPVEPMPGVSEHDGALTIVVATLDEAHRIAPCLTGLSAQGRIVREILVVDSRSTDGTRELVEAAAARDPRIRLLTDPPLPKGWIGKAWALQHGLEQATTPWVLGMDADTEARPGLAEAVVAAAEREGFDVVSFAPRFDGQTAGERLLQPSMLVTLVYRFGAAGDPRVKPDRVMANGQCFLVKREVLLAHGGYDQVKASFAEDVSLARALATAGVAVGFLDGSKLYTVRAYANAGEMWREWGRSLDLRNATSAARLWLDILFLAAAQGAPLLLALWLALGGGAGDPLRPTLIKIVAALLAVRWLLQFALAASYAKRGPSFWLSPLSDPIAFFRIPLSALRRPTRWRSRTYA
jgi:dolichol-phosphate mannosyltransferase